MSFVFILQDCLFVSFSFLPIQVKSILSLKLRAYMPHIVKPLCSMSLRESLENGAHCNQYHSRGLHMGPAGRGMTEGSPVAAGSWARV